ncbi:hypothetical protein V6N11_082042 [Hibiscus sabdariffa]|uniref:Uncharacterized protein n=1 Tax=Hibiscus sabdariffa TaxID=183260 RepID=A0ABR2QHC9_9ROSI
MVYLACISSLVGWRGIPSADDDELLAMAEKRENLPLFLQWFTAVKYLPCEISAVLGLLGRDIAPLSLSICAPKYGFSLCPFTLNSWLPRGDLIVMAPWGETYILALSYAAILISSSSLRFKSLFCPAASHSMLTVLIAQYALCSISTGRWHAFP